jgi:outer membrane protein assembly factor BamB
MNAEKSVRILAIVLLAVVAAVLVRLNGNALHLAAVPPLKAVADPASQWSCFRGPNQGVGAWDNAPIKWDGASGQGVLWKVLLTSSGIGSPVLWGDRLYLTAGDEKERTVIAFDANNGKQLWRQAVPDGAKGLPLPAFSDTGLALNTPVCDAEGVYALFGTGDLAAFSHDGVPKWQLFLNRPLIGYGY